jgi:hypothetical protein
MKNVSRMRKCVQELFIPWWKCDRNEIELWKITSFHHLLQDIYAHFVI